METMRKIKVFMMILCMCVWMMAGCAPRAHTQGGKEKQVQEEEQIQEIEQETGGQAVDLQEMESQNMVFGEFTAYDSDRNPVTYEIFSEYAVNMVYIWATYSEECMEQLEDLAELSETYQEVFEEGEFQIVGIPIDTLDQSGSASSVQLHEVKEIMKESQAEFLQVIPSFDLVTTVLKDIASVPVVVFVDENGMQIGEGYQGFLDKENWSSIIEDVVGGTNENSSSK